MGSITERSITKFDSRTIAYLAITRYSRIMTRSNADDRRAQVVDAAISLFAHHGYEGTKTSAIAAAVGVSQPYLFQLFPTKKAIFIATWHEACDRILERLREAVAAKPPGERLSVLAAAYDSFVKTNRDLLTIQIQAWAASPSDKDIAQATREGLHELQKFSAEQLGVPLGDANLVLAAMTFYNVSVGIELASSSECSVLHLLGLNKLGR